MPCAHSYSTGYNPNPFGLTWRLSDPSLSAAKQRISDYIELSSDPSCTTKTLCGFVLLHVDLRFPTCEMQVMPTLGVLVWRTDWPHTWAESPAHRRDRFTSGTWLSWLQGTWYSPVVSVVWRYLVYRGPENQIFRTPRTILAPSDSLS